MQFLAKVFHHHHLRCHRHVRHLVVHRIVFQNHQMIVLLYSEVSAILTRLDCEGLQMDIVRNIRYIEKRTSHEDLFEIWRDYATLNKELPLLD